MSNWTNLTECELYAAPSATGDSGEDATKTIYRFASIVVLIFGLMGNILTCYVIITRKAMRRSIHMYTLNLAATDLLILVIYLPTQLVLNEYDFRWKLGKAMCSISFLAVSISLNASIATLVAITADRHRGVVSPFKWRSDTQKNSLYVIPAIWALAIALSIPFFYVPKHMDHCGDSYCFEKWHSETQRIVYWMAMFVLQFFAPIVIIVSSNLHILYRVYRGKNSPASPHTSRILHLVCALVIVYIVCTAPQHVAFFCVTFSKNNCGHTQKSAKYTYMISNLMVIAQSAINPVIYGTFRQDFKQAFSKTLQLTSFQKGFSKLTCKKGKSAFVTESSSEPQTSVNLNNSPPSHLDKATLNDLIYTDGRLRTTDQELDYFIPASHDYDSPTPPPHYTPLPDREQLNQDNDHTKRRSHADRKSQSWRRISARLSSIPYSILHDTEAFMRNLIASPETVI